MACQKHETEKIPSIPSIPSYTFFKNMGCTAEYGPYFVDKTRLIASGYIRRTVALYGKKRYVTSTQKKTAPGGRKFIVNRKPGNKRPTIAYGAWIDEEIAELVADVLDKNHDSIVKAQDPIEALKSIVESYQSAAAVPNLLQLQGQAPTAPAPTVVQASIVAAPAPVAGAPAPVAGAPAPVAAAVLPALSMPPPGDHLTSIEMRIFGKSFKDIAAMERIEKLEYNLELPKLSNATIKQRVLRIETEATRCAW